MTDVFIIADNIFSPLGINSVENFTQLKRSVPAVKKHHDPSLSEQPFYAALFDRQDSYLKDDTKSKYTKFEKLIIASITDALQNSGISPKDKKTLLIISSTKGNISLLESETYNKESNKRILLSSSAKLVAAHFHFANPPVVISSACISGVLAILTGLRMIRSGQYENVVIAGADVISKFVLSGFQSFQAISDGPCKPFDADRAGINLGEGAGTIILSSQKKYSKGIKISGGSVSNDANHISGPSRTGEQLNDAITKALKDADLSPAKINFISAHGTATLYNDEMEARAITLAEMQLAPVNSLKGYYGHTLGAAGLIESIVSIHSMQEGLVIPTMGFRHMGVTKPVNICTSLYKTPIENCLKTASGFGGCNAAVIFSKQ